MRNEKTIRILHCVNKMDRAGLETLIMNYYRSIDKNVIQFDFLTHRNEPGAYDNEIKKLGGKVYYAPRLIPGNYLKYFKYMKSFFKAHPEYKIVHSHIDTMSYFPLKAAKMSRIPIRIAHSHTSKLDVDYKLPIKYLTKKLLPLVTNTYFACGKMAGKFLFGKGNDITYIKNAINIKKFSYNAKNRINIRKKYNILDDEIVIGHVGRYIYIKNQSFLLDLLSIILSDDRKFKLILVGSGKDKRMLEHKAKKLQIEDNVIFIEDADNVNEIYNAFDIFIMPSLFEGLPLVGVEAQANGLCSIFSENISKEILITSNSKMISLKKDILYWKEAILKENKDRNANSTNEVINMGYDIETEVKKLEKKYVELYRKGEKYCEKTQKY